MLATRAASTDRRRRGRPGGPKVPRTGPVVAVAAMLAAILPGTADTAAAMAPVAAGGVVSVRAAATIQGRPARLDISLRVEPGQRATEIVSEALARYDARPLRGTRDPSFEVLQSGLRWPQFFDRSRSNDAVVQFYNPTGEPETGGDYGAAFLGGQRPWSEVESSTFRFASGGRDGRAVTGRFADGRRHRAAVADVRSGAPGSWPVIQSSSRWVRGQVPGGPAGGASRR